MNFLIFFILYIIFFTNSSSNVVVAQEAPQYVWQIEKGKIPKVDQIVDKLRQYLNVIDNFTLNSLDYYDYINKGFLETKSIPTEGELKRYSSREKYRKRKVGIKKKQQNEELIKDHWILTRGCFVSMKLKQAEFLKEEIRISGFHYLLPRGYMGWHTNVHDPLGWRLYYIELSNTNDETFSESYFQYLNPLNTSEIIKVKDKSGYYNLFKLRSREEGPLWHSTFSENTHRFSIGFHVNEDLIKNLIN